jgi:hypothetical protein
MTKTYGQLVDGDIVFIQGYRFQVADIRVSSKTGEKTSIHGEPNRADVIRFKGIALDPRLAKTGYNGVTYGAYADVPVEVAERVTIQIEGV